jgi:MoaA/NifB/PqqE/SkfB family radical SAM enzyme
MPWEMFVRVVTRARELGAKKLTLLGGEPTLYKALDDAILLGFKLGLQVRVITNGTVSFRSFLRRFKSAELPTVVFSVDGASPRSHDRVRGAGSFEELLASAREARERGYRIAGISTVTRWNLDDAANIVKLADDLGFAYLNVHAVSPIGFAGASDIVNGWKWLALCEELRAVTTCMRLEVRVDSRYLQVAAGEPASEYCAVREASDGNVMVFPDGRVFTCALFIGETVGNSYYWEATDFLPNVRLPNEASVCSTIGSGCPGMSRFAETLGSEGLQFQCMYRKRVFRRGGELGRSYEE